MCMKHFSTKGPVSGYKVMTRKRAAAGCTSYTRKSDREISLFGPKDPRTPLPGNVGTERALYPEPVIPELSVDFLNPLYEDPDVITSELNVERQSRIADQVVSPFCGGQISEIEAKMMRAEELFECSAHQCPELLAADVRELFPGRSFTARSSVICISLRNSDDNYLLKEEIMDHFIHLSQSIVNKLQENGYWADFIDPFVRGVSDEICLRASFFETDLRYRTLGLELMKMGSCVVVKHHKWGSKQYVGSVFTSAPYYSPEVREVIRKSL